MKQRYSSRPSRGMSVMTAIVGFGMLVLGIFMMLREKEFHPFFIVWILAAISVIGYHLFNVFSTDGAATTIIESDEVPAPAASKSAAERLRELDALKEQQLVSDEEYEIKRNEILKAV